MKNWIYAIICAVCIVIGGFIALWSNNISNIMILQPNYAPDSINWIIAVPVLSIFPLFMIAGFIFGKVLDKE